MSTAQTRRVIDLEGLEGIVEIDETVTSERVLVSFGDEYRISVPTEMLIRQSDGSYQAKFSASTMQASDKIEGEMYRIPIVQESINVEKRDVVTGLVRIIKSVQEEQVVVDEPLMQEQVEVERVAVNQYVDAPLDVRYEGDTMIVPLVEEVLVVQKRLLLREELRITKRQIEKREPQQVTVRREEVNVERVPHNPNSETSQS